MIPAGLLRTWLQQCIGVLVLALLVWAFLNTPDDRTLFVLLSGLLALASFVSAAWLLQNNFTGSTRPALTRFLKAAGCLAAMLLLLWILRHVEDSPSIWKSSEWLSSAVALKFKKSLAPIRIDGWFGWLFWFIRWIAIPMLFIPLIIRAGGARPTRFWRFALVYLAAFLIGAVAPHYLVHWVPRISGFRPQLLSAALRFVVAYLLMITAWVFLGHSSRQESRT